MLDLDYTRLYDHAALYLMVHEDYNAVDEGSVVPAALL